MNKELKVLVIEDDPGIMKMLQSIFKLTKIEALYADTGRKGLELIKDDSIGLVLCDIMLPDIIGYDILKQLRAMEQTGERASHVAFAFLTAFADPADVQKGKAAGADEYITKPFSAGPLIKTVKSYLTADKMTA